MFIIPISDFILRAFGFKTESAEDIAATHDDDNVSLNVCAAQHSTIITIIY